MVSAGRDPSSHQRQQPASPITLSSWPQALCPEDFRDPPKDGPGPCVLGGHISQDSTWPWFSSWQKRPGRHSAWEGGAYGHRGQHGSWFPKHIPSHRVTGEAFSKGTGQQAPSHSAQLQPYVMKYRVPFGTWRAKGSLSRLYHLQKCGEGTP